MTAGFDRDAVRAFLDTLHGDSPGLVQVCATGKWNGRAFHVEHLDAAADYAARLDREGRQGIYVRATTLSRPLTDGERGGSADALALPGLWADIDIAGPGHKHDGPLPLPPDEATARAIVVEAALPDPTAWVHSGGGLYPWWLLATPHTITDHDRVVVEALSATWQRILGDAAARLGRHYGTGVGDLARVLRIPGTINRKAGLERPCRVIEHSGARYTLDELYAAAAAAVGPEPAAPPPPRPAGAAQADAGRFLMTGSSTAQPGPFDALAESARWADLFDPAGLTFVRCERDGAELWVRAGAESEYSIRAGRNGVPTAVVHSENVPGLPAGAGRRLTMGRVFAHLHHRGDEAAAARDLRAAAAGDPAASAAARALPLPVLATIRERCGVTAAVRVVEPAAGKDVTEHLAAGRTVADLVEVASPAVGVARRLRVTRASTVPARRTRWLWDHRIVLGGLTLLAGREGLGKSTVAVDITAQITRGLLDGEHKGEPCTVVYVNSEDARDYTIVPRLIAAGADLDRVVFVDAVTRDDEGDVESPIVLPLDVQLLAQVVREQEAVFVVLDAATSTIDSRLDGDRDRQMRQGLEAIARGVGEATGCAVLGIVHFGKRESADTGKLILGSIAWSQVARSVLAVARDDEDGHLVVSTTKANLGPGAPSLGARIVNADIATDEGTTGAGRVEWLGETDRDARDLLGSAEADDRTERDEAVKWLTDYLHGHGGEAPAGEVIGAAVKAGFSKRTVQRARQKAGVSSRKASMGEGWVWAQPAEDATKAPKAPAHENVTSSASSVASSAACSIEPALHRPRPCPSCGRTSSAIVDGRCPPCRRNFDQVEAS